LLIPWADLRVALARHPHDEERGFRSTRVWRQWPRLLWTFYTQ